jgi:serine/threonine protein kinase
MRRWVHWWFPRREPARDENPRDENPDDNELRCESLLGKGAFGHVYVARWRDARVAAKYVARSRLSHDDAKLLEVERRVWSAVEHECVMPLLAVQHTETHIVFVTELMDHSLGTLLARMRDLGARPRIRTIANGMVQVARGMAYLHGHTPPILHRDLKSDNVLIKGSTWKVGDFGLARFASAGPMTAETGSYRWMAPEVIRHEPYGPAADIYSFGMLMYECLTLAPPFVGLSPVEAAFAVARDARRPPLPPACSESSARLVRACWAQDPTDRPPFPDVVVGLEEQQSESDSFGSLAMATRERAPRPLSHSASFPRT